MVSHKDDICTFEKGTLEGFIDEHVHSNTCIDIEDPHASVVDPSFKVARCAWMYNNNNNNNNKELFNSLDAAKDVRKMVIPVEIERDVVRMKKGVVRMERDDIEFMNNVSVGQYKKAKQKALYDHEGGLIEHYGSFLHLTSSMQLVVVVLVAALAPESVLGFDPLESSLSQLVLVSAPLGLYLVSPLVHVESDMVHLESALVHLAIQTI
ncbi:hypothetical protein Tco_1055433 [Tanacetum coccineum]|uniref:Uncharacterized protein n=1 Tax=Tanacetum coccineum TaxID=301880 RepID=A0ABQ5GZN7_9ASTR